MTLFREILIYGFIAVASSLLLLNVFFRTYTYFDLTTDQRMQLFFSENAFYYSFYNDVVNADSLSAAYQILVHDARSEYGHEINAIQRFNIYQEIGAGVLYRCLSLLIPDIQSVLDPFTFYLTCVYSLFGIGVAGFVRLGRHLTPTKSWLGSMAALLLYIINYYYVARVQVHPPLRENFGMPMLFLQLCELSKLMRTAASPNDAHWSTYVRVLVTTTLFLLFWQFAHILLFVETGALAGVFMLGLLPRRRVVAIVLTFLTALAIATTLMFGSAPMYTYKSLFFSAAAGLLSSCALFGDRTMSFDDVLKRLVVFLCLFFAFLVGLKRLGTVDDDSHIFSVLMVRLGLRHHNDDFQIRIYTTQAEFSPPKLEVYQGLSWGMALPFAALGVLVRFVGPQIRHARPVDWFLLAVLVAGGSMMAIMMRFTVVAAPMCILCACAWLVPAFEALPFVRRNAAVAPAADGGASRKGNRRQAALASLPYSVKGVSVAALLLALAVPLAQRSLAKLWYLEHTNGTVSRGTASLDLCRWARRATQRNEAFVGDMVVTSLLRLCSDSPIVSHPQYENAALRRRARLAYEFYGLREPAYLHDVARQLNATYILINRPHCKSSVGDGSRFVDMVNRDWTAQGHTLAKSSLCESAHDYLDGRQPYFDMARFNDDFYVLRVRASDEQLNARPFAEADYVQRTLAHDAEAGASLCALARFEAQRGLQHRAAELYELAESSASPDAACLSTRAREREDAGDVSGAVALYERSIQLAPNDTELLTNYAVFLDEKGDTQQRDEAGRLYRRVLALRPDNPTYRGNYATYLYFSNDIAGAGDQYMLASQHYLCDANTLCAYAVYLRDRHNSALRVAAQNIMERAQKKEANNACVREHVASLLGDQTKEK